ncbi:hypothetical protein [Burkholderia glumae]|uniref:hypothetical protein n=1 Tax=Burkholderia glumae TaxID=337 RepID=UPI0020CD94C8|nr:hypothetical protein [Burkholderia glumae]MCQ0034317.1 hypothetical protein [Burkholderia glumae]MCQ0038733.1 hypothetical protein [Burkholderia glumae]
MKFITARIQRGVGQGGFHTASFRLKPEHPLLDPELPYELTYDCGTNSVGPGGQAISAFLEKHIAAYEPAGGIVDALFVSHLDQDHYNGAEQLCRIKTISRIFLPYFSTDEIILFLLEQLVSDKAVSATFANAMLGIAGGDRQLFGRPVTVIGGPNVTLRDPLPLNQPAGNGRLQAVVLADNGHIYPIGSDIAAGANIALVAGTRLIPWIFRPWSYKQSPDAQAMMADTVDQIPQLKNLKGRTNGITAADLNSIEANKDQIRATCQKIIAKAKGTKASDYNNNNAPSICLYSGPRSRMTRPYRTVYLDRGAPESMLSTNQAGWLTTGDALLQRHWPDFHDCYKDVLGLVGTYVLPHHGSEHNHSPDFVNTLGGRLAIICARQRSTHHPSDVVLNALYQNNAVAKVIDEYAAYGLREIALIETDD